jgi:hypothetical protein
MASRFHILQISKRLFCFDGQRSSSTPLEKQSKLEMRSNNLAREREMKKQKQQNKNPLQKCLMKKVSRKS